MKRSLQNTLFILVILCVIILIPTQATRAGQENQTIPTLKPPTATPATGSTPQTGNTPEPAATATLVPPTFVVNTAAATNSPTATLLVSSTPFPTSAFTSTSNPAGAITPTIADRANPTSTSTTVPSTLTSIPAGGTPPPATFDPAKQADQTPSTLLIGCILLPVLLVILFFVWRRWRKSPAN